MPTVQKLKAIFEEKQISLNFQSVFGNEIEVSTKWLQTTKVEMSCNICKHCWTTAIDNITRKNRSSGCPACAKNSRNKLLKERGQKEADASLKEFGYSRVGEYKGCTTAISVQCNNGHPPFNVAINNFRAGQRCPICSGNSQYIDSEDAVNELILGTSWSYDGQRGEKFSFSCNKCNSKKEITRKHLLKSRTFDLERRQCDCERYAERYEKLVSSEGYTLLEKYTSSKTPILHEHNKCRHTWKCLPYNFIGGTRCPKCARKNRSSSGQMQIANAIKFNGFQVEENVRGLDPDNPAHEVDIFVPCAKLAIEFDGVWWHAEGASRNKSGRSRIVAKKGNAASRIFNLRKNGIRLVRVFSDEWANFSSDVLQFIFGILNDDMPEFDENSIFSTYIERSLENETQVETAYSDLRFYELNGNKALIEEGFQPGGIIEPLFSCVHPSRSNERVDPYEVAMQLEIDVNQDAEAIFYELEKHGFSRVWDCGYQLYTRKEL